jgi:hypothetical protein
LRRSVLAIAGVIVSVAGTRVLLIHGLASLAARERSSRGAFEDSRPGWRFEQRLA